MKQIQLCIHLLNCKDDSTTFICVTKLLVKAWRTQREFITKAWRPLPFAILHLPPSYQKALTNHTEQMQPSSGRWYWCQNSRLARSGSLHWKALSRQVAVFVSIDASTPPTSLLALQPRCISNQTLYLSTVRWIVWDQLVKSLTFFISHLKFRDARL